jgi:hypothetical protein
MIDLDPFDLAEQEAKKRLVRARHKVQDFLRTVTTGALLKSLGGSMLAVVVAAINFPVFAFIVVTAVIVGLAIHAVFATRIMKAQDRQIRWAYVDGKRAEQAVVEARIAVDTATLALMGERHAPGEMRGASPDLRSALAYHQQRLQQAEQRAEAAEAVKEGTATAVQRTTLARLQDPNRISPQGPAIEPIKARRLALDAERKEFEVEIQALATADSIAKAMSAEEVEGARRTRREIQDAAQEADQAARERVRAGKAPTRAEPEHLINLAFRPNGERDVTSGRGKPTPEQIARGEGAA